MAPSNSEGIGQCQESDYDIDVVIFGGGPIYIPNLVSVGLLKWLLKIVISSPM